MSSIHVYAEILLNIGSASLVANLDSNEPRVSTAYCITEGETIRFQHDGDEVPIYLPSRSAGKEASKAFNLPATRKKSLSLRLKLGTDFSSSSGLTPTHGRENLVPWDASSLSIGAALKCASCGALIVPSITIRLWKDLPSENWAEMMDFWHCHKPDVPHTSGDGSNAPDKKGYSASNSFLASAGVGLVATSYFLIAPTDTFNTQVSKAQDRSEQVACNVLCGSCAAPLGSTDENAQGVRLLKSSLRLLESTEAIPTRLPVEKWLASHIITRIETQAARKFLVRPSSNEQMLIWVLTPDYLFCSATTTSERKQYRHPTRAMKVLYKHISIEEADQLAADQSPTAVVDDLDLPIHLHQALILALRENSMFLPASARDWSGWLVSLLCRFDTMDVERQIAHEK